MNCQELKNNINHLKSQRDSLQQKLDQMNETMQGKSEIKQLQKSTEELEDQLLEQYKEDFAEKNPEIIEEPIENETIKIEKRKDGYDALARSVSFLSNGNMLIAGDSEYLCEYKKDQNNKWQLCQKTEIPPRSDSEFFVEIKSIFPISDTEIVLHGSRIVYDCKKNNNGEWQLNKIIEGIKNDDGTMTDIYSVFPLEDDKLLVGGENGLLYECEEDGYGGFKFEKIENIEGASFFSACSLSDNKLLIGFGDGKLYEYNKNDNDGWQLSKKIEGFPGKLSSGLFSPIKEVIDSISPVSEDEVLIGGSYGTLCDLKRHDDGEWYIDEEAVWEILNEGYGVNIKSVFPLSNDDIVIGSYFSSYECRKNSQGKWVKVRHYKDLGVAIGTNPNGGIIFRQRPGSIKEIIIPTLTPESIRKNIKKIANKETG